MKQERHRKNIDLRLQLASPSIPPTVSSMSTSKYKLVFFCPTTHTRVVLEHIFDAFPDSVGRVGNYSSVAYVSSIGMGQFVPGPGANPVIGEVGELEYVEENRVEMPVTGAETVAAVVRELKTVRITLNQRPVRDVLLFFIFLNLGTPLRRGRVRCVQARSDMTNATNSPGSWVILKSYRGGGLQVLARRT